MYLEYDYGSCYYLKKSSYLTFWTYKMMCYTDRYLSLVGKVFQRGLHLENSKKEELLQIIVLKSRISVIC